MIEPLTLRERAVVEQLGEGRSTRQIAEALGLSHGTVIRYMATIRAKTGLKMREIACAVARGDALEP